MMDELFVAKLGANFSGAPCSVEVVRDMQSVRNAYESMIRFWFEVGKCINQLYVKVARSRMCVG